MSHQFPFSLAAFGAALALTVGAAIADPAASVIYIPTGDSAEVAVIDAASNAPLGRIGGLPAAHGLAVTPDGSLLVVGSFDERDPGGAMPDKPAGVSAADHAAHHGAAPAAASGGAISSVSIVEAATGSVLRRIDVPGAVHHVAVSPDGAVAAVTHPNGGAITAIDLRSFAVIRTVSTGTQPNYAVFSPDGGHLYVSNAGDDDIAVIDTSSWTVTDRLAAGASPEHMALSAAGDRLFVNNVADGTVSVIDPAARRTIETLPVGDTPHGIDLSNDGGTLFVALLGEDKVVAVDLGTRTFRSARLGPAPYHLAVIDGRDALYVSSAEDQTVWVLDAASLETRAEIAVPGIGHQFAQKHGS